jgi:solute carrier family 25 phosphate transporter 23/24/25/41
MQCETVSGGLHGNRLIMATAAKMWRTGGVRAFYKGLNAGLVGIAPYAAIDLATFEYLKNRITDYNVRKYALHEEDARPSSLLTATIGAFSGSLGATVVYPINLLRIRLQTQGTVLHPPTYTGFWNAAQVTVGAEGWRGLYKGLLPNLVKVVPAVSIVSFSVLCSEADRLDLCCVRTREAKLGTALTNDGAWRSELRIYPSTLCYR